MYLAPEVITDKTATKKSDVFSYAIILCAIVFGTDNLYPNIKNPLELYAGIAQGMRFPLPENWPDCIRRLVTLCWHQDPNERPTFEHILEYLEVHVIPTIDRMETDDYIRTQIPTSVHAQNFWAKHFHGQNSAPLDTFVELLCGSPADVMRDSTDISILTPKNLKAILLALLANTPHKIDETQNPEQITIEAFGYLLHWAPFCDNTDSIVFHNIIWEMAHYDWFHGFVPTTSVKTRLLDFETGTFLIRCSNSSLGVFTVSYVKKEGNKTGVNHMSINRENGEFSVASGGIHFKGRTLPELVHAMRYNCLPSCNVAECNGSCIRWFSYASPRSELLSKLGKGPKYEKNQLKTLS